MKTIFLSAGHSLKDPGAVGKMIDARGMPVLLKEADVAVEVRNIVSFYLHQWKVAHVVDGTGTANIPLGEAVKLARRAQIPIEFHCNASDKPGAHGVETLSDSGDMKLGNALCYAIAGVMGSTNRGAKGEASGHHARLGFVQASGIIVELFFISNAGEVATYQAKKWLLGKAIAEVLAAHARAV